MEDDHVQPEQTPDTERIENLGEAAVQAQGSDQADLSEHESRIQAGREDDIHRAEAMARAGDEFRTKKARAGHLNDKFEKHATTDLYGDIAPDDDSPRAEQLRSERLEQHERAYDQLDQENDVVVDDVYADSRRMNSPEDVDAGKLSSIEAFYGRNAESIEDWAGILHDHPVSERYLAEHPGLKVTAESMAAMEELVYTLEREVEQTEKVDYVDLSKSMRDAIEHRLSRELYELGVGVTGENTPVIAMALSNEQRERWNGISAELDGVLGKVDSFHKEMLVRHRVDPLENQIALTRDILEDVRSGRASQH